MCSSEDSQGGDTLTRYRKRRLELMALSKEELQLKYNDFLFTRYEAMVLGVVDGRDEHSTVPPLDSDENVIHELLRERRLAQMF